MAGTFRQSLDLAAKGSLREAQLGCDFVLGLDPEFYPARRLADLLATAEGPVDVSDLAGETPPVAPEGPLFPRFEELLAEREFEQLLALAAANRERVAADPGLQQLVAMAQEKAEAEPYLRPFLDQARAAVAEGRVVEAERALVKARALDPDHPEIARIALRVAALAPEEAGEELVLEDGEAFADSVLAPMAGHGPLETGGDARIEDLLREGQAAFDRGEFQEAIDAWSRIFLVDIDHREASRLVDLARQRKAEAEREIEELFHEAVLKFEAGDAAEAREGFERVLAAHPGYYSAREYLALLDEGDRAAAGGPAVLAIPLAPLDREAPEGAAAPSAHEIFTPPEVPAADRPSRPAAGERSVAAVRRGGASGRRLFLLVGGGVFVALLAAGLWLWQSREELFPNSQPPTTPAATAGRPDDPIASARRMHEQGRTAQAISLLRRLPSGSPDFVEAQTLVSQWEALVRTPAAPAAGEQIDPEQQARRQEWLDRAAAELAAGERVRALLAYEQAAKIAVLDGDPAAELAALQRELEPLATELELVRQEDWELLLNNLWRRREAGESRREVERMMVDAYYNLGLRDLQRGDAAGASAKFGEGLAIDPQDVELQRFARFARTYQERGEDL
ncbi:MAG TPA: hypothetical protein VLA75_01480, partial [Thermoanaerobaculia bacterium]|nr:hypothetical protein [Thermoanaerobaculia bacterium]